MVMSSVLSLQFHRRYLRRIIWVMLVGWLWALTAGMVNACALAPSGAAGHDATFIQLSAAYGVDHAGTKDHPKPAKHQGQGGHVGDPGHEQDADKASCLKACDDGSSALSKGTALPLDPGTLAIAVVSAWCPEVSASDATTWLAPQRPSDQRLPLTIRFQRLTL